MKRTLLFLCALLAAHSLWGAAALTAVSDLRVNGRVEPLGVEGKPVFSWTLNSNVINTLQSAWEITITEDGRKVFTYRGNSAESTGVTVPYPFAPGVRYGWTVKVTDNHRLSSKPVSSTFVMGLGDNWKARWIGVTGRKPEDRPSPVWFRRTFTPSRGIKSAYACISAHGIFEAQIGGTKVGDEYLAPGWTAYHKRLQYRMYDVTSLLKSGRKDEILVTVAPGWWNSGMNWQKPQDRYRYGDDLALLLQLEITYTDGSRETLCTGHDWETSLTGPVSAATIYDGQDFDYTQTYAWQPSTVVGGGTDTLVPSIAEGVKPYAVLRPVALTVSPKGEYILDFGQNIVGWERARLKGPAGRTVILSHAEVLDKDGNFYTANLRKARAQTQIFLDGKERVYEPTLTFYGFRYLRVEGLDTAPNLNDFEAVAISSGFDEAGTFACSNDLINRLQSNIRWGFRDNFVDIPTDCPQRDERLGWTGDAQVFFRTASWNGDVANFFRKWLADLSAEQKPDGSVPRTIPDVYPQSSSRNHAAGWADCATLIPWQHYQAYGDVAVLQAQYPSMKAWADWCLSNAPGYLYNQVNQPFGDWLFYSKPDDRRGDAAVTSRPLIAQCFFAASLDIVAKTAALLGKDYEARQYADACKLAKAAFVNEYVTPSGRVSSDTQTAYVLALHFDMLPDHLREQAAQRLVDNVVRYKDHITTGFLGTPYICEELSRWGHSDVAWRLLLQETCPGWLYQVKMGATTIWERWDSMGPDGSLPENGMNSFNHYSYGAVGDWLYRWAGGIRETEPGYRSFVVDPHPGGGLAWLETSHRCPYGDIRVKWTASGSQLKSIDVQVPVGCIAVITCPDGTFRRVGSGSYHF